MEIECNKNCYLHYHHTGGNHLTNCAVSIAAGEQVSAITPAKGLSMPRTIEHYQANADRDNELILEMKDEIGALQQKVGQLEKTQLKLLLRLERKGK